MTNWTALTERTLSEIEGCDPVYRPTSFWRPGLPRILQDIEELGLEQFKSWPTGRFWFYPRYGLGLEPEQVDEVLSSLDDRGLAVPRPRLRRALEGLPDAQRDFDAVRLSWNRRRWPFRVERLGESRVGRPPQRFRLGQGNQGFTKPYLNYLLCLAALSKHVDRPPRSFLEIGGGFGVLGEIVLRRDEDARYVDLDIPPLCTVASYYLSELFGDRITVYDESYAGSLGPDRSAVLPNWRIDDVAGPFDVFVNSFSFQEMEPDVVAHYADKVAAKDVEFIVSLNSRHGKNTADQHEIGVQEQVTSARVVELFEQRGYTLCGAYGEPMIRAAAELVVMRKQPTTSAGAPARQRGTALRRTAGPLRSLGGRVGRVRRLGRGRR